MLAGAPWAAQLWSWHCFGSSQHCPWLWWEMESWSEAQVCCCQSLVGSGLENPQDFMVMWRQFESIQELLGTWQVASRELCAGAAALGALTLTQNPFLSCCQAPGAGQDELCAPWCPCAGPGALPSLRICLLPAGQGPSLSPRLPLAASAHYNFIS